MRVDEGRLRWQNGKMGKVVILLLAALCLLTKNVRIAGQADPVTAHKTVEKGIDVVVEGSLVLSDKQQAKFEHQAPLLEETFPREKRYDIQNDPHALNIVNAEYAFLHIWKNGGTTIAAQTKRDDVRFLHPGAQRLKWFTLVRDPIEHFLSGWAECGDRAVRKNNLLSNEIKERLTYTMKQTYDLRIKRWLQQLQKYVARDSRRSCEVHSLPQANFLLVNGSITPQLVRVGDLQELRAMMQSVGFPYDDKVETGRNASASDFKSTYFPQRKDLILNETMQELCDFLGMDYFLFDFDLPPACRDQGPQVGGKDGHPQ